MGKSKGEEVHRRVRLTDEVQLSIELLQAGLRELQGIDGSNALFHVPLLLISSGLERLMKSLLCLSVMAKDSRMPIETDIPRTHDLTQLLDRVLSECFDDAYVSTVSGAGDWDYLQGDPQFRHVLSTLSAFGQQARYFNLNVVLGRSNGWLSPEDAWSALEWDVLAPNGGLEATLGAGDDPFPRVNKELVKAIERTARAMSRLFTLSAVAPEGRVMTGVVSPFLFLPDERLGETIY